MLAELAWDDAPGTDIRTLLSEAGAVLLTGAAASSPGALAEVRKTLGLEAAACAERFARRTDHGDGVFSWPEWAPERDMCLHHEQSQSAVFPGLLLLANLAPADSGGTILLGDTREVLANLPVELADRFRSEGWTLVRNFRPFLGLPWQEAFGQDDRDELTARLAAEQVGTAWAADGTLSTAQLRPAVVTHPGTGQECWFNDVAFFSQWSVQPDSRMVLLKTFGERGIPLNTLFGAGDAPAEADYDAIMDAYERATTRVSWQPGDVLVFDNVLTAHGREPYTGPWEVAVALAEPATAAAFGAGVAPTAVTLS